MAWHHLSINKPHLVYIILGGFTSLFMLCSSFIKERLYIGEATVATLCGIIFGPHAADLINPLTWGNTDQITLEFSRIVLVVQCFAVGVELPKYYMEKHWRSVTFLLIPVMTFGWLITSLFIWWMILPLDWLGSLCVAACVTATDPVLASSVVGKGKFAKRVPKHLRDLLSAESGCNDGMAFPFIYLALYIIDYRHKPSEVAFNWIVISVIYECVFGALYGFIIGYIGRHGIKYAEKHDLVDRESFLVFYFVLALFCAGSGSILGVDDLLVGFAAGVGFSNDGWFTQKTEESHVSNVIDLLINLAYFVYLGTIIPWEQYNNAALGLSPWRLVVIAIFVIFFRRIPIMMALKPLIPDIKTWREALFAGHFGPIGVGAIFVAILARAELETGETTPLAAYPDPDAPHYTLVALIWPITTFLVISSIIVHGSSIAVFTLGKHINTLTLTMSYTTAQEGPSWMNRLPRISSTSRSQAKSLTSDTDGDELRIDNMPPGTLPPIGVSGNFLRRQKEEDNPSRNGSRASSLIPRRRKKKWDDGRGPGGPISESAIYPQRRNQSEHLSEQTSETLTPGEGSPHNEKENDDEKNEGELGDVQDDSEMHEILHRHSEDGKRDEHRSDAERNPEEVEIYEEGEDLIIENEDGEVISHQETPHGRAPQVPTKKSDAAPHDDEASLHGYQGLKKKLGALRHKGEEESPKSQPQKKRGPALAYQFGNTIIVEDEDGEVVKKYDLPPSTRNTKEGESKHARQRMANMTAWTGFGPKKPEGKAGESSTTGAAQPSTHSAVRQGLARMGTWVGQKPEEDDEEDDRHIRFTIGGAGRRLTKEDFLREIQSLDPKARSEIVEHSDAPDTMKDLAKRDASKDHPGSSRLLGAKGLHSTSGGVGAAKSAAAEMAKRKGATISEDESEDDDGISPGRRPSDAHPRMPKVPAPVARRQSSSPEDEYDDTRESAAERRRREQALKGVDERKPEQLSPSPEPRGRSEQVSRGRGRSREPQEEVYQETAAEKRRRDAALGLGADGEDSDDDDTERVPPPVTATRSRGIRFAQSPVRGKDSTRGKK
ncbi:alkali metal cation/H+ antiporter Nha1 C terminus-domain-containing protein [Tricladium varicosporioides]|nr:alkali metal cation/H+ antiporter Nha1 C terminus-domain-containing protein [Hymenoscyphus varicosporioides]